MKLETTKVYKLLELSKNKKVVAFQGSARASKTYNILIWLIIKALSEWQGFTISIVRQTLPSLKASVERDFFEILQNMELYVEGAHNKSDRMYNLNGNLFEFFSCDQEQKLRGRKRDILFCNEVLEFKRDSYRQLTIRTQYKIIADYNPSAETHWFYDDVLTRKDCMFLKITYKDNPFLSPEQVREIEVFKDIDENYWRVFGLGERGAGLDRIFSYNLIDDIPEGETVYGLDFGFNVPTALVRVTMYDGRLYAKEILYQAGLTNQELIVQMYELGIEKNAYIYADAAEPARIKELNKHFNCKKAMKDVKAGIDFVKGSGLFVDKESINLIKELNAYSWKKDKDGNIIDEPIKINDHIADALRYSVTHWRDKKQTTWTNKTPSYKKQRYESSTRSPKGGKILGQARS